MNTGRTFCGLTDARCRRGLSLIEIMVTVTLLVVIILGLTAMFNQTRKAFTVGLGNVDYQDAGRTAMDLITRELEQMSPTYYSTYPVVVPPTNTYANALNFYADVSPAYNTNVTWPMTAGDTTNFSIERLFFVTRYNQQWNAIGYRFIRSDTISNIGTLYRYASNNISLPSLLTSGSTLDNFFFDPAQTNNPNLSRVVDGVVDFRIRAYDRNGVLISVTNPPAAFRFYTNYIGTTGYPNGDIGYGFYSNAVPAYVEVELGILESPTLARLQAFAGSPTNYFNFLTNHAGQVHIFRQRVTIPAVDSTAYP
jgi:hypothetical protein